MTMRRERPACAGSAVASAEPGWPGGEPRRAKSRVTSTGKGVARRRNTARSAGVLSSNEAATRRAKRVLQLRSPLEQDAAELGLAAGLEHGQDLVARLQLDRALGDLRL